MHSCIEVLPCDIGVRGQQRATEANSQQRSAQNEFSKGGALKEKERVQAGLSVTNGPSFLLLLKHLA